MKIQGRTITGLGLVLLAVIAILAAVSLAQNAHASAPTTKSTYPAPLDPCGVCNVYFSDITQTCAPDGSVDWVATVTNNGSCILNLSWVANLLIQRNYGNYEVVQSIPGGPQDFPPGDTNIGGSFNYPIPPDATGQQVVIQFDTPGDPCGIVENTSGVGDPCVSTTGTPANTSTRTRTRTNTPVYTNTRTNTGVPNTNTHTSTPTRTATSIPATRTRTPSATDTPTGEPEPTDTPTIEPPTDTPIPQETCPPGAPTRIPTPAFTPRPGCSDVPPAGVVVANITDNGATTDAEFVNTSSTCSYRIGLAVYKKFDENIDNQELYDYRLAIIPPNSTLRLTVNNPPCAYQSDAFYGDIIYSFAGGVRYGMRNLDTSFGNNGNYCTLRCVPAATATRTATPGGCNAGNPCAGIYSPGYWANNHPQHTDAQFQSYLNQTDFAPITIQQAQCYLSPSCVHEQTRRAILTGQINAAANSTLAQGVYRLPGSSVDGMTVSQILDLAYDLWSNGQSLGSDLANAVGYVSGGALGDGSNGEGQPAGSCRVVNERCLTPTRTRTALSATNTRTPTPGGATNTRTHTATPGGATNTRTRTNTPTRTATPGNCGDNPCAGIYSPGYWANNHPQHTDAQFQSFLDQTNFAPITIQQAQCYLKPNCGHDKVRRAILAAQINVAGSPTLANSVYRLSGSSIDGQTPSQFVATAYQLWSNGQTLPSDLANAIGYISGGALGNGSNGEGQPPDRCRLQNVCLGAEE